MASDKIINTTDDAFDTDVVKSNVPVVVDFWATWCGPCRSLAPVLDELAEEYDGKIKIVKVNVDENQKTPQNFNVRGIPTLVFFKGGQPVDTVVGNQPKESLKQKIDSMI